MSTTQAMVPFLSAFLGVTLIVLGMILLAVEHHDSPILQKASIGALMLASLFATDEAVTCYFEGRVFDWRLGLFLLGTFGAWTFRLLRRPCFAREQHHTSNDRAHV